MGRQLTTVDIMGTVFLVDAFREELRQQDNPANRIPFQVFDPDGNGYRFLFDTRDRTIAKSKSAVMEDIDRYCWAVIPALMELDPEGIALRYDIPLEILYPENKNVIPQAITATVAPLRLRKGA